MKKNLLKIASCLILILVPQKYAEAKCDKDLPSFTDMQKSNGIHPHFYMRSRTIFCGLKTNTGHYLTKFLSVGNKGVAKDYLQPESVSTMITRKIGAEFGTDSQTFVAFTNALIEALAQMSKTAFNNCDTSKSNKVEYEEYLQCLRNRKVPFNEDDVKKTYAEMKADSEEPLEDKEIGKYIKKPLSQEDFVDLEMSLNNV